MEEQTLYSLAVEFFGDLGPLERDIEVARTRALAGGGRIGRSLSQGLMTELRGAFGGGGIVGDLLLGGSEVTSGGAILRGVAGVARFASDAAAQLGAYRRQLALISGDAKTADSALARFQQTAASSNFDTAQVVQLGTVLAGRTGNLGQAATDTQKIIDAAAALGVDNKTFGAFQTNLAQILAKNSGKIEMEDIRQLRTYASSIGVQIARSQGISLQQANRMIDTGTGRQLYDAILKIGERNAGAARNASSADPQSVLANIRDDLTMALGPTGEVFNRAAVQDLQNIRSLVGGFAALNKNSSGAVGVALLLSGAAGGVVLLARGAMAATASVQTLTAALTRLAAVAPGAAVGASAGAGAAVGAGAAAGAGTAGAGLFARIAGGLRAIAGPAAIGLMRQPAALDDQLFQFSKRMVGGKSTTEETPAQKIEKAAQNLLQAADALKITSKDIGLGVRGRGALHQIEREYVAMHLRRSAAFGVG